jgi:hypothetical protein
MHRCASEVERPVGLRLGLVGDFHFPNGFVVPVNPGLDLMNLSLGLSYQF